MDCASCLDSRHRRVDARQVALLDHLAHTGAQGVGEHRGVNPSAHQDHAHARPGEPHRRGEVQGAFEVDRRPDHDGVFAEVGVEVPPQRIEGGKYHRVSTEGRSQRLRRARVVVEDRGHHRRRSCGVVMTPVRVSVPAPSSPK